MPNDATQATAEALPESTHLARLHFLHSEMLAQTEAHNTHVARREDGMIAASPIMTLFREFEVKYRQAGDMSFEEEFASGLLDECNSIEKRIMALPVSSEQDLAAKLIVNTRYGDFVPGDIGTGGLLDQALSILAVRQHPDAELLKLAAERNHLVALRQPISEKANQLDKTAREQWEAAGHTDYKDWDGYLAVCEKVGALAAEDAREAIDDQIAPLDNKMRTIPAQTAAGLKVKLDLLRYYLPTKYVDEGRREDQDFDVCLLNELSDEAGRLAEAETSGDFGALLERPTSDLSKLIADHTAALAAYDAVSDEDWMNKDDVTGHAVDAAQEAMFKHRPSSLSEARQKAAYMASSRTFTEWDNFDRVKLIEALTPAPISDSPIMALFREWNRLRDWSDEKGIGDDEVTRRCRETDAVMVQISALPSTSALDFAAKLSCITHYGAYHELSGDVWGVGSALVREAAALVGHPEHVSRDHMGK